MPNLEACSIVFDVVPLVVRFVAVCPRCGAETVMDRCKPIHLGCGHIVAASPKEKKALFLCEQAK